jgi:HrpA-like RNA helicase
MIVCTQPRRLAASSIATRVAAERNEKVGDVVGYHIQGEKRVSANTRLLFCTTGILLQCMKSDPALQHVTHVIVDEGTNVPREPTLH